MRLELRRFVPLFGLAIAPLAAQSRPVGVRVVTELGDITVELYPDRAPRTVANFLRYVDGGLYTGGTFFRTVRADNQPNDSVRITVIQGGAPGSNENAYPPIKLERTSLTGLTHVDGTISMARDGPDTATSSFFFCVGDQPALDFGGHRNRDGQGFGAFGKVTAGMDVVRRINAAPAEGQRLIKPVGILRIERLP
jgi:peptidyl-prolyl cis-trans isomerase A (cyclophilin A)